MGLPPVLKAGSSGSPIYLAYLRCAFENINIEFYKSYARRGTLCCQIYKVEIELIDTIE